MVYPIGRVVLKLAQIMHVHIKTITSIKDRNLENTFLLILFLKMVYTEITWPLLKKSSFTPAIFPFVFFPRSTSRALLMRHHVRIVNKMAKH